MLPIESTCLSGTDQPIEVVPSETQSTQIYHAAEATLFHLFFGPLGAGVEAIDRIILEKEKHNNTMCILTGTNVHVYM